MNVAQGRSRLHGDPGILLFDRQVIIVDQQPDGRMIDLARGEEYPSAEIAERLLAWTATVRGELGIEPVFPDSNSAQRQRAMLHSGASMQEVYEATVRETRASYAEEVTA